MSQQEAQLHPVIAFRAEPDLHAWADEQAAIEGISRSDVAHLIRDRQRLISSNSHTMPAMQRVASMTTTILWGCQSTKAPPKNTATGPTIRRPAATHDIDLRNLE